MVRIHTEDLNRDVVLAILDRYFEAYTVIPAIGRWRGKAEAALTIEVAGATRGDALAVAEEIRRANNQEAVLVTITNDEAVLVNAGELVTV